MKKETTPDPFALAVSNGECIAAIHRLEDEGKKIYRLEVVPGGYVIKFYIPQKKTDPLVELLLDFSAD